MSHTTQGTPESDAGTSRNKVQQLAAETLGTFVLVLFGCGSLVLASSGSGFGDANILSVGLSFGLAVTVMAYAVGTYSDGHFNPAVSVAAALGGRMAWKEVPAVVGAQFIGGILGAAMLLVLALGNDAFDPFETGSLGANGWGDDGTGYPLWAALLAELVLTAIFAFIILAVTDARNTNQMFAPLVIGLTLAVIHFVAIPLTGTSVNPARSLGPALFSGTDSIIQVWVFLVAPTLGGLVAGLAYPAIFGHGDDPVPGSGMSFSKGSSKSHDAGYPQQAWGQPGYPQQGGGAQPGGYYDQQAQPAAQQPGGYFDPQGASAQQPAQQPAEQPIIQDGWQWDPQAQQWIPAQQPPGGESTAVRPNE